MEWRRELGVNGFVFLPQWQKGKTTKNAASSVGMIMSPSKVFGHDSIADVQKIIPREKSEKLKNQYSGHFGLGEFPLHSDLAHWSSPPKFLILRCCNGSENVTTNVLPFRLIYDDLMDLSVNRAVVKTRQNKITTSSCLLPLVFNMKGNRAYRWDSLFLEPVNSPAIKIKEYFERNDLSDKYFKFILKNVGDTLILNNWINLHGRSQVTEMDLDRVIERIYVNA